MCRCLSAAVGLALLAAAAPPAPPPKPVELVLDDQFGRRQDVAAYRGEVVLLVYGDRKATDACHDLGEKLHVLFHPTAAGQTPGKARSAPVAPLQGVPSGKRSPDVVVIPVAAIGGVPGVVRDLTRAHFRKGSPEVPVWLDFGGVMEREFGMKAGQPNLAVIDAAGHPRMTVKGTPDQPTTEKLLQTIQNLRGEAAGLGK